MAYYTRKEARVYNRAYYKKNKKKVLKNILRSIRIRKTQNKLKLLQYLKTHHCVDCGEKDVIVPEFDHLRDKRESVYMLLSNGCAWKTIEEEIQKCEVVCCNCHKRRTTRRGKHWRIIADKA